MIITEESSEGICKNIAKYTINNSSFFSHNQDNSQDNKYNKVMSENFEKLVKPFRETLFMLPVEQVNQQFVNMLTKMTPPFVDRKFALDLLPTNAVPNSFREDLGVTFEKIVRKQVEYIEEKEFSCIIPKILDNKSNFVNLKRYIPEEIFKEDFTSYTQKDGSNPRAI